jgi:hypothetical protein
VIIIVLNPIVKIVKDLQFVNITKEEADALAVKVEVYASIIS